MDAVHGRFAAVVLGSARVRAVVWALETGVGFATIDLAGKMIFPLLCEELLYCEGKLLYMSKSLSILGASLKTAAGKIIATALI